MGTRVVRGGWIIKREKKTQKTVISYTRCQRSWEGNTGVRKFERKAEGRAETSYSQLPVQFSSNVKIYYVVTIV